MSLNVKVLWCLLLLAVGAVGGFINTQDHYLDKLEKVNQELASAKAARNNLETLATEQGLKLGELVKQGSERALAAQKAQDQAREEARPDYAAANRILQERIGGDDCQAANTVIDQELGL